MFQKRLSSRARRRLAASTVALGVALASNPALADQFQNPGFETGDITGWTANGGKWNSGTWVPPESEYSGPPVLLNIENAGNKDAITNTPTVFSGNHSVKLNDAGGGLDITSIRQSVNNYTGNKLYFAWNAVLEPSHGPEDSPAFIIKVVDKTTNTVVEHIAYSAYTAQNTTVFRQAGSFVTSDWKVEDVNMTNGHDYEMIFVAIDCAHTGHAGYLYVDDFGNTIPVPNSNVTFDPTKDVISGSTILIPIGGNFDIGPQRPFFTIADLLAGTVNPNFVGGTLLVDGTLPIVSTPFTVQSAGGIIDTGTFHVNFTGGFSGAGSIRQIGTGTVVLSDVLSSINGSWTLDGGTLRVNTAFSGLGITVNATARLGGSGQIIADVHVNGGGFLSPGNSPGTLTVAAGDVTLDDAATFETEIDGRVYNAAGGAGTYDRLALTNGSTFTPNGVLSPILRGISGPASNTFTPVVGDTFTIVSGGTINAGAFDSVLQPAQGLAANTRFDVLYRPTSVTLAVTPANMATFGAANGWKSNAVLTAAGLEGLRPSAGANTGAQFALYDGLYGLNSEGLARGFSEISGELHADVLQMAQGSARRTASAAMDAAMMPWGCNPEPQSVGPFSGSASAALEGCGDTTSSTGASVWGKVLADSTDVDGDARAYGYHKEARGVIAGANVVNTGTTRIGFGAGFTDGDVNDRLGGSADLDTMTGFVYASQAFGPLSLGGVIGYESAKAKTSRTVNLTTGAQAHAANYHVDTWTAAIEARYNLAMGKRTVLRPVAGIDFARSSADGVKESGSATSSLSLPKERWTSARTKLGAELAIGVGNPVEAQVFGNWRHELKDATAVRAVQLGGAKWLASSVAAKDDTFEAGAKLGIKASNAIRLELQYGIEKGGNYDAQTALGGVSIRF